MKFRRLATLMFVFSSQIAFAQGFGEYGGLLGGVGPKSTGVPKGAAPGKKSPLPPKPDKGKAGELHTNERLYVLIVQANEAGLYSRGEEWAEKVGQVARGEKLTPMLESSGSSSVWYLVKTESGATGWVKAADVSSSEKAPSK